MKLYLFCFEGTTGDYLNSYVQVIMVLNYLMNGLEYPLIPCLQDLPDNKCGVDDCFYNKYTGLITAIHCDKIKQVKDRYHTCVVIQNDVRLDPITDKTVWVSKNKDSIETLLIGYFNYYAQRETISDISIVRLGISITGIVDHVIQDPLSPSNTIM